MAKPKTIDEYLAALTPAQRTALQKVRKAIKSAAPKAEECISYSMPGFRLNGKVVAVFRATSHHCAYHPMSSSTIRALKKDLANFDTSKGTVRFQPDKPLSAVLVRKLVKTRIAETL